VQTRAMQVQQPGGRVEVASVSPPSLEPGWVRVEVVATGVCGADLGTVATTDPAALPATPGHEVAGRIAALGEGVRGWQVGDRVAVGWFGGSCGTCEFCRRGDVVHCAQRKVPGINYPGGWAESITVPADALARIPEELDFAHAAPLGCAGVTTFNAVRGAGVRAGGRVAIFGIGGLGHLAVQFSAAMGYEVVAMARGSQRAQAAADLGADHYFDLESVPPAQALSTLGGVDLIISTIPAPPPLKELMRGLRPRGQMVLLGVDSSKLEFPVAPLVMNALSITGHLTGSPVQIEETMRFAVVNGVRPWIERLPLTDAQSAVEHLRAGEARFRMVLEAAGRPGEEDTPAEEANTRVSGDRRTAC